MSRYRFFCIAILLSSLLFSACTPAVPEQKKRYFFPPSPVEPKIEYLKSYSSDHDLKPEGTSFMTQYVLGESRSRPIFTTPVAVASDGKGRVFVADSGARKVFVLDLLKHNYRELSSRSLSGGEGRTFGRPFNVEVADDGRIYVSDVVTKKVDVFSDTEVYLFSLEDPEMGRPTATAVDLPHEVIYVTDTTNHRLVRFDLQGNLLGFFGERGEEPGQFNFPTDLDVDEQGHLYVLDSLNARVQVFDETGTFLRMFGERGTAAGSFSIPKNLAVSKSGQVYVTDALAHKVVVFSLDGELLLRIGSKSVGTSPGGFYLPRGIDADDAGGIWIADSLNRTVHQFQFLTPDYLREHPVLP